MMKSIWKYGRVVAIGLVIAAMLTTGHADARRGGVGKTVEGSEVTDETLTGADINESTLKCGGPGGIPGCGVTATPPTTPGTPPVTLKTQLGTNASKPLGYPAIKTATVASDCPAGTTAISGLVDILGAGEPDNVYLTAFGPSVDGRQYFATAKATNSNPSVPAQSATLRVFAICASIG